MNMRTKKYHVVPLGNIWAVRMSGSNKPIVITTYKQDSIDYAKKLAAEQKTDVVIHTRDGKVRNRNGYKTPATRRTLGKSTA